MPNIIFRLRVTKADVTYDNLVVEHLNGVGGSAARLMGEADEETRKPYTLASREQAVDFMADYPEYGEMRWYSDAIGSEQVSFSWRRMSPGTGGRVSFDQA